MKKIFFIPLMFVLVSCTVDMVLPDDGTDKVNVMTGSLCSADSLHTIVLAVSSVREGMIAPPPTVVRIFVNNALEDEVSEHVSPGKYETPERKYVLKAHFAPGDDVRIIAENELGTCEVSQKVPEAPVIGDFASAGMTPLTYNEWGNTYTTDFTKLLLTVRDGGGQNAYRVRVTLNAYNECIQGFDYYDYHYYKNRQGTISETVSEDRKVYNLLEPEMRPPFNTANATNDFNLFNNSSFVGSDYTLTLCMKGKVYDTFCYPDIRNIRIDGEKFEEVWVRHAYVEAILESVPYEAYRYLLAVEYDTNGTWLPLTYEPSIFPNNVQGGIGYVMVSSASTASAPLPDRYYGEGYPFEGAEKD